MNSFQSLHLKLAQDLWEEILLPTDNVIDATCGNGYDTLFLAKILSHGKLFCFDIQKKAIENTTFLLQKNLFSLSNIFLINASHQDFSIIKNTSIKLVVYNLGYLPNGDKKITTMSVTTLLSIQKALNLIIKKGALSITCYPRHEEGNNELIAILAYLKTLDHKKYEIHHFKWEEKKPQLFWIKKL